MTDSTPGRLAAPPGEVALRNSTLPPAVSGRSSCGEAQYQTSPEPTGVGAQGQVDWREQLFNGGEIGPISHVQLPPEAITSLRGILLDIDPVLYRRDGVPEALFASPQAFYDGLVRPWLARHPALAGAKVLDSGRGLHVVVVFAEPVQFKTDGERLRWGGVVKAVQAVLPTDPDAPGVTAVTRPVGSINGKNGAAVRLLEAGWPVPAAAVLGLYEQLRRAHFRTVMGVLFGSDRVTPCPACRGDGTTLAGLDRNGECYGGCGKVSLGRLHDIFLAPRSADSSSGRLQVEGVA